MQQYYLIKNNIRNEIPFDLLLLADESKEAIEQYIYRSSVYLLKDRQHVTVAVIALYQEDKNTLEIKNIAVAQHVQHKGIGSFLIDQVKKMAKEQGIRTLLVGTGDGSLDQLRFYKRNGFIQFDIRKDFFLENYPSHVVENGIVLKDMILLKQEI